MRPAASVTVIAVVALRSTDEDVAGAVDDEVDEVSELEQAARLSAVHAAIANAPSLVESFTTQPFQGR